jgi:DNA (cytosine-5)-methyltransferase 1
MLKLLDLFSGIGGFSLGLESTGGFETIAFVEKNEFCQKVLKKHWPNITIEGDIRNVKGEKYQADIITGGFPCQPFSVAGKRKGTDDDRYLWDETIRIVRECKPRWFIGENVEGLININNGVVLRQVQTDLEEAGFQVQCIVIPAASVGAWHQRKRIWIMAYSDSNGHWNKIKGSDGKKKKIQDEHWKDDSTTRKFSGTSSVWQTSSKHVSNTNSIGLGGWNSKRCATEGWSFLSRKQERSKMGSKTTRRDEYVSNSKGINSDGGKFRNSQRKIENKKIKRKIRGKNSNGHVSNSYSKGLERHRSEHKLQKNGREKYIIRSGNDETKESWWKTQSRICRIPDGVSVRMDRNRNERLKSLGNSIVPQIVRELGFAILTAERS